MRDTGEIVRTLARGVSAGILGTGLMTLVFIAVSRLFTTEKTIAPSHPERLVARAGRKAGVAEVERAEQRGEMAAVVHFAYGAGWGAIYAFARRLLPVPAIVGGPVLGLVVWAIGFVGWLPTLRHLPEPWQRPPARVVAGLLSHVVYGLGTAAAYEVLASPRGRPLDAGFTHVGEIGRHEGGGA